MFRFYLRLNDGIVALAADVVLMDDQPSKVATAIALSRRTLAIARQNVTFAIGIEVAVLILATFGLATMWLAVFADVGAGCAERYAGVASAYSLLS